MIKSGLVLIAREAGARFIAVYVNRAPKQMGDGITLERRLATVLSGSTTQIVAASLKSTTEAIDALMLAHSILRSRLICLEIFGPIHCLRKLLISSTQKVLEFR